MFLSPREIGVFFQFLFLKFVNLNQKHPNFKGFTIEKKIVNNLHPNLEELLDKYQERKEEAVTDETIRKRGEGNQTLIRKVVDFFKKTMSSLKDSQERELRVLFV